MLGLINFTHSDPLFAAYEDKSLVRRDTPKGILASLLNGRLDCGMISLFEYFEHRDILELVESATIHSLKGTMSTLLVSRTGEIKQHMVIAVTEHTRTTAVYLELVLKRMGISYELLVSREREAEALLSEAEYALVIGDEALRVYGTSLKIIWDIGFQFSSLFGLKPLFSVTVRRKGGDCSKEISLLDGAINGSIEHVRESVRENSRRLGLPEAILEAYYRAIRYDFNNGLRSTIEFLSGYHEAGRS